MGKPIIIDIAGFYRLGKFKKIEKSEGVRGNFIDVKYYPPGLKGAFGITETIHDVPREALIGPISPWDERCPWEDGVYFLLAAENGHSPGLEKLDRLRSDVIAKLSAVRDDLEISASLANTRAELAEKDHENRKTKDERRQRRVFDEDIY